jgi:hypothetical protein
MAAGPLACVSSDSEQARSAHASLATRHDFAAPRDANAIVALLPHTTTIELEILAG